VPLTPNSGEPVPFFTNSIGRFAIANLRPGMKYRVELYSAGGSVPAFEFTVPQDTTGLVDLHTVSLPPAH
jgi:outer membrane usher protein